MKCQRWRSSESNAKTARSRCSACSASSHSFAAPDIAAADRCDAIVTPPIAARTTTAAATVSFFMARILSDRSAGRAPLRSESAPPPTASGRSPRTSRAARPPCRRAAATRRRPTGRSAAPAERRRSRRTAARVNGRMNGVASQTKSGVSSDRQRPQRPLGHLENGDRLARRRRGVQHRRASAGRR